MGKTGLALGGGAVLGAAHIGVLRAIEEKNINIDYICGTSIGAFVAAFYAFGKSWEEIAEIAMGLDWMDITALTLSKYGLMSNSKISTLIHQHIGNKNIEDAEIPLAMVAADASSGEKVILDKGPVAPAVEASTCIPGIFVPVEYKDRLLVDGGIVENVPISTARSLGAEFVIGVDLNAQHNYQKPGNILDVILNSFHFIMMHAAKFQTENADLLIKPNLGSFNRTDTGQIKDLIKAGYKAGKISLTKLNQ